MTEDQEQVTEEVRKPEQNPPLDKTLMLFRTAQIIKKTVGRMVGEVTTGEGANRLLLRAIRQGDYFTTERMLLCGVDANTKYDEQPGLHIAAAGGFMDICICLVRLGMC